ncbi:hypothetical protein T12_14034 [Trichinella patagoniensis]|uniref:Uncharacterized protein n=1 Tax=Trichinella patagoniensis TaxID=990121 RepID=A0A0V0WB49_9BILA|nr:hypothetical protein T12_14034 [Trichinella patagoniensis]
MSNRRRDCASEEEPAMPVMVVRNLVVSGVMGTNYAYITAS